MLTIQRLSYADAETLIAGAEEKADELGIPMCIAVTDESGFLIAYKRMDGGKPLSSQLALDKAFAAAVSRRPTHYYNEHCVPGELGFGIQTAFQGRFSTVGGGVPVEVGGSVVGAIGVSGGTPHEDTLCADAAIHYFHAKT